MKIKFLSITRLLFYKINNRVWNNTSKLMYTSSRDISIYLHWPYCEKRCTYCNFNKYINHQGYDEERMRTCLEKEVATLLRLAGSPRVQSIFFGGGTPSLASAHTIGSIVKVIGAETELAADAEVSIEVNPTPRETDKLRGFRDAGVNRVSIGVQSLSDEDLKFFGRTHSADDALKCISTARQLFPGHASCDVIFGRPRQTVDSWKEELSRVAQVADEHLSLYQLTLERGTALFKQVMDRKVLLPDAERMAELYEAALQILSEHGFYRYEVSNFAKSKSAESSHNTSYWSGNPYIGVGPGAHGRWSVAGAQGREWRVQTLEPLPWMREVELRGHGTRKATPLSTTQLLEEVLCLGLRTAEGIPHQRWSAFSDVGSLHDVFADTHMGGVLQEEGFIVLDHRGLRCTELGLNVCDSVTSELLAILQTHREVYHAQPADT